MSEPLKILFYDLETSLLLAHTFSALNDYIPHEMMRHDSFLLCWGARWRGEKVVQQASLTPQEALDQDDARIVALLADLIREADIVVAHNIAKFDWPMFNARLLQLGMEPLPPVKMIDTYQIAKTNFRLAYNKLDYLASLLLGEQKIKTDAALWLRCYHGDPAALRQMARYNKKDVVLLEQVFEAIIPYAKSLPRLVNTKPGEWGCPYCGSSNVHSRGYRITNAANYQRFYCLDCRQYSQRAKMDTRQGELRAR